MVKSESSMSRRLYFFFQAEDGIRYRNVTGVQTCALPIFDAAGQGLDRAGSQADPGDPPDADAEDGFLAEANLVAHRAGALVPRLDLHDRAGRRSEERRVGKECRARRPPPH